MSGPASARPVILVVEDEVFIRFDVADMLRDGGFEVIEACDVAQALNALQSGAKIDLVFSDIQMPGAMSGLDLAKHILASHAGLPVILTSGGTMTLEIDSTLTALGPVEPKPYDPQAVLARIRAVLSR